MVGEEKKFQCVLLVDDDDTSNFISKNVVDKLGIAHHTHTMVNGKQALDYIEKNCDEYIEQMPPCPDFILLDVNMPVMDGFQFLEAFYKKEVSYQEGIKIVMLTSSINQRDVERSRKYPIHGYLDKPLTMAKLQKIVEGF